MTFLSRCVFSTILATLCGAAVFAQHAELPNEPMSAFGSDSFSHSSMGAAIGGGGSVQIAAPSVQGSQWFLNRFGIGTFGSTLGLGARIAVSLTSSVNLRAGASYFSYTTDRSVNGVPYTANIRLQSEQAVVDWYPFHGSFHITPGVQFGSHDRFFGNATITPGNTLTLNGVTYYAASSGPVQASGAVDFRRTSPMLTVGWGNWIRHPWERHGERHLMFPFEFGAVFSGDPATALSFSGDVCTDAGLHNCMNIANDPEVQKNVQAARVKFQNDANDARFYPVIAGGIVYRF